MNSPKNETLDTPESHMIPLGYKDSKGNPVIWNLNKGQITLSTPVGFDKSAVFATVSNHAEKFAKNMEWCAYDLPGDMFPEEGDYPDRVAHDLEQAWKLSMFLSREITKRTLQEKEPRTVIILINDGDNLFKISDPEDTDIYMDIHDTLKSVLALGQKVGVHLLMHSEDETLTSPKLRRIQDNGM